MRMKIEVKTETIQAIGIALALCFIASATAFAQDLIGAGPISEDAIFTFKAIALAGIGWGFLRLMSGRHTVEGLAVMGAGALGLAKAQAVAAALGLGG